MAKSLLIHDLAILFEFVVVELLCLCDLIVIFQVKEKDRGERYRMGKRVAVISGQLALFCRKTEIYNHSF